MFHLPVSTGTSARHLEQVRCNDSIGRPTLSSSMPVQGSALGHRVLHGNRRMILATRRVRRQRRSGLASEAFAELVDELLSVNRKLADWVVRRDLLLPAQSMLDLEPHPFGELVDYHREGFENEPDVDHHNDHPHVARLNKPGLTERLKQTRR